MRNRAFVEGSNQNVTQSSRYVSSLSNKQLRTKGTRLQIGRGFTLTKQEILPANQHKNVEQRKRMIA